MSEFQYTINQRDPELSLNGHRLPEEDLAQRHGVKSHGVGLCVEVYLGAVGVPDGIKLENQVLITETGYEDLTTCPFDKKLMACAGLDD